MLGKGVFFFTVIILQCGCVVSDATVKRDENTTLKEVELRTASCPTWMHWDPTEKRCMCDQILAGSVVFCTDNKDRMRVSALHGYCMTHAKLDNQSFIVGTCQYNTMRKGRHTNPFYLDLPLDPTQVDNAMCGDFHRTGQLCGQCKQNYSPPVYSYHPQCVNCTEQSNWGKYLAVSLLPQTAFFVGVLTLRFSATSPHMSGFILYSQLIAPPPVLRLAVTTAYKFRHDINTAKDTIKLIAAFFTFHGIWNMDFFRLLYEPFCLSPHTSMLQILALDYITAVYPLLLIALIFILVKLYYYNCTPIVLIWRPFRRCSFWFSRQWNIHTSLVDAFATFLVLSYIKFLSVSFTLLFPAVAIYSMGGVVTPTYLFYVGTVEYFGEEHLPYALLAIANLMTFTIFPILILCLYPCRSFQRCLNRYNLSFQALHTFMDAFQGSFKNGTDGTRDCRYFAALYLILRVVVYLSLVGEMLYTRYWFTLVVVLVFLGVFTIYRPFKQERHNRLHTVWLLLLTLGYGIILPVLQLSIEVDTAPAVIISLIPLSVPPLCVVYVVVRSLPLCFRCWRRCFTSTGWCRRERVLPLHESGRDGACAAPLLDEDRNTYGSMESDSTS